MREAGLSSVALLPYNVSAGAKYEWLGLEYGLKPRAQAPDAVEGALTVFRGAGIGAVAG